MLYHTKLVAGAAQRALVIGDMPFMSYQASSEDALRNAGRFLQAGAQAIKLEGGAVVADRVAAMTSIGIPGDGASRHDSPICSSVWRLQSAGQKNRIMRWFC